MNEWEFTAEAAGWINEIIAHESGLPFDCAKCEQQGRGSRKRRDLTILDKNKKVILTGEIKLPYNKDGGSPYNAAVVRDARSKAREAGTRFFFTWNVNEFVLWETHPSKTSWKDHNYKAWDVTSIHSEEHLELPMTVHAIRTWLRDFLIEYAQIHLGRKTLGVKSPDEKFIDALESSLRLPILFTAEKLDEMYETPHFKRDLDCWMREEQGWIIYSDPEGIRENLLRAAKFACYSLVNRLVFHEALLKRFGGKMAKLAIQDYVDTGEELRIALNRFFAEAKEATGDYETVFGKVYFSIGNRLPHYSDLAVPYWRELINQIHDFDFSKLDYEVIGSIFERFIAPEERHKYGQFYTRVEVVDLINSFCIRNGDEKIIDPACGGGTFLVRAYARKRNILPRRDHESILSDLYGIDISNFATHLTTINLATRDLVGAENYPRIARSDFFDVESGKAFLTLPKHVRTGGLGAATERSITIPPLDAAVGNPPYIRQEAIGKEKKENYRKLVKDQNNANLSGRSDIHCYFWPHASSFLKNDGLLCFLTSSQWLDVEYGFRLQEWILCNFEITAIIESVDEPWFVGARVATTITILRRQQDPDKRMSNTVRFIQLLRPIKEILVHDGTLEGAIVAADRLRDEILSLKSNTTNERFRARLVRQCELWKQGVQLGVVMGKYDDYGDDNSENHNGEYYGGKWGVYLRAPDLWFELMDRFGSRFVPLGEIAEIHRGITSGKDVFFFPKDVSDSCLQLCKDPTEFREEYGVPRKEVASGKVKLVLCGEGRGEIRPIESKYLEPEIHSLMEITGFTVAPEDCSRMILLVGKKRKKIKDKYLLDYLEWGEKKKYHEGSTCAARVSEEKDWYDLTGHENGSLFWPMAQQYKHAVPVNEHNLICNHNLFDVTPVKSDSSVLAGILNSSWAVLSKYQYGRPVGVEGNLKTEVVDVKMMLVPNPTSATKKAVDRVAASFEKMKKRKALQFLSERRMREMSFTLADKKEALDELSDLCELDMDDRRELDDAVLEMMGVESPKERRKLIDSLYAYLRDFFEATRRKEEKAIVNKKRAKRGGAARPSEIAEQILDEISENHPRLIRNYDPDFIDVSKPYDVFEIPDEGTPKTISDMFSGHGVMFTKGKKQIRFLSTKIPEQDELVALTASSGVRGAVRFPREPQECLRVLREYDKFIRQRDKKIRDLIEERTADEELQVKIYESIISRLQKSP